MSSAGSVTVWLDLVKCGDPAAVQKLWDGYFRRLVGLARQRLRGDPRRADGAEDVALSAFDSFFRGAERGRFPRLSDRQDLWQVLFLITTRKVADLVKREHARKRGAGRVANASALAGEDRSVLSGQLSREPDPLDVAQFTDECRRLLGLLGDDTLRTIAVWKMEGWTNEEVAVKLDRSVRTVELKLRLIRKIWEGEVEP
jgi:DNA-directed RNA polymerase specialized sigma24 family protein